MIPIVLLTDFGHQDPYVAMMKGVILSRAPGSTLIDLCHEVPAQCVDTAAFFLEAAVGYFPADALFVSVVDPGVGSKRSILWGRNARGQQFLAPDNGLLDGVGLRAVRRVTNRRLRLAAVSATFHGRDIFAPVAAALANGTDPVRLGPAVKPKRRSAKRRTRRVIHIDRFGNAVTALSPSSVPRGKSVWIGETKVGPLRKTYSSVRPGAALALVGSYGLVECSVREGDFASEFKVKPGDSVHVQ